MTEFKGDKIAGRREDNRNLNVEAQNLRGRYRTLHERWTGDAAQNDTVILGYLPSHAVLSQVISELEHSAFGASVTCDLGFKDDTVLGISSKGAALASALDVAAAGVKTATVAIAIADRGKKLYELAGLTADPKVDLPIVAKLAGANPASGTLVLEQAWVVD